MIDDFARPQPARASNRPRKEEVEEDFFPDLSMHIARTDYEKSNVSSESEPEEDFLTPQEAAEQDDRIDETVDMGDEEEDEMPNENPAPIPPRTPNKPPKKHWWNKPGNWFSSLSKKQKALVIIAVLFVLGGIGYGAYSLLSPDKPAPKTTSKKQAQAKPTTVASNLTGLPVAPEINQKPVTGVMVENSIEARPQAGLADAGVVIEAIAEGGITRFLALYQDAEAASVGPIRSIRPYYIDWGLGFDAAFAHVGGSPEALQRIRNENIKDLDQSFNPNFYERVSGRYAPHNVFTPLPKLNELEQSKNYGASKYTSLRRKKETPSKQPNAQTINLNISSQRYNVSYSYDMASNTYARSMGGIAHVDANSSQQIAPKVVVAMVMSYGIASDGKHSVYNTIGSGQVYVFQDGIVTEGTWNKASATDQITFTNSAGEPLLLNPGKTWITAVNSAGSVKHQP